MIEEELRHIEMRRYPLRLSLRSRAQVEELLREFQLMEMSLEADEVADHSLPKRLIELVDQFTKHFAGRIDEIEAIRAAALARGEAEMDLVYELPVSARGSIVALGELLEECDAYCRSDAYLLTLETPSDIVAFRRWSISEVVGQLDGNPPAPWPGDV
ncbi:MAG: hypothetical protein ABIM89_05460 [Mycobacteriales bacterium]